MRSDHEDTNAFNTFLKSGKYSFSEKMLTANVDLTINGSLVNFFDPNGGTWTVTMPPFERGRFFVLKNNGAGFLTVDTSEGAGVTTLTSGQIALLFSSHDEWAALSGGASSIGVFTNLLDGLVPAPESVIPGALFLRDDQQWAPAGSYFPGSADTYLFMSDGVNTSHALGAATFRFRSSTGTIGMTVTDNEAVFGDNVNLSVIGSAVDHNTLLNYSADEHVPHTSVTLTAGSGLSGGGDISASRTFNLDLNDLTVDTPVLADTFGFYDVSGSDTNKATLTALNAILDHNALVNYVADQHVAHSGVSIVASTGLTGGGNIAVSRSLAIDFNSLTTDTIAAGDFFAFYDISGGDHNKVSLTDLGASILTVTGATPSGTNPIMDGTAAPGVALTYSRGDHVHPTDTTRAPTANPAFTGIIDLGGVHFATQSGNYQVLYDGSGRQAVFLGGTGDPVNYYRNGSHRIEGVAGSPSYINITSASALFSIPITGGTAANSTLTIESTTSASASGDRLNLYGSNVVIGSPVNGPSVIDLNGSSGGGVTVNIASSGNGLSALNVYNVAGAKQIWVPGGGTTTITFPTVTGTLALLASPAFTGSPTTPTAGASNNSTVIANTAYVDNQIAITGVPQNSQSVAYTLVLADAQKHILHPSADTTARTFTIPANSSVAYPVGTALTFVNQNAGGVVTIAITTDTMRLAGAGTTGNRTLAANGVATALKITTTEWIISGTGLT